MILPENWFLSFGSMSQYATAGLGSPDFPRDWTSIENSPMAISDTEVVIVGGGAAGIAAGRRLVKAAIDCLLVEARPRLGGRAWTITGAGGLALDLGCGWLHSADRNPWLRIAEEQGRAIDRSPPPWQKPPLTAGFPREAQQDFARALSAFFARLEAGAHGEPDVAADRFLEPGGRWNGLIDAIATYITGANLARVSTRDLGEAVEIRVRDNGTGIPPEIRDKLFQPFFTTKPTGEGTGLGLSISWDIVTQQHGGTIAVDSRAGEFTEFAIHLPRTHGAVTGARP